MGEFTELGVLTETPGDVEPERVLRRAMVDHRGTERDLLRGPVVRRHPCDVLPNRLGRGGRLLRGTPELGRVDRTRHGAPVDGGDQYGINLSPANWQEYLPFAWQAGAQLTNDEGALTLDNEGMVEGLTYYDSFFEDGVAAAPVTDFAIEQGFVDGTHPIFFSGPWHMSLVRELGGEEFEDEWDVAVMPKNENRDSFVGGANLVVFNTSEQQELAWKFVNWMSQPETQQAWYETVSGLPGREGSVGDGRTGRGRTARSLRTATGIHAGPARDPRWEGSLSPSTASWSR